MLGLYVEMSVTVALNSIQFSLSSPPPHLSPRPASPLSLSLSPPPPRPLISLSPPPPSPPSLSHLSPLPSPLSLVTLFSPLLPLSLLSPSAAPFLLSLFSPALSLSSLALPPPPSLSPSPPPPPLVSLCLRLTDLLPTQSSHLSSEAQPRGEEKFWPHLPYGYTRHRYSTHTFINLIWELCNT